MPPGRPAVPSEQLARSAANSEHFDAAVNAELVRNNNFLII